MPIINQKKWKKFVTNNQEDEYGRYCVDVAQEVMRLLDKNNKKPINSCYEYITTAEHNIFQTSGLSGFQAFAVASMVSQCHSRGKEFEKQWKKENK